MMKTRWLYLVLLLSVAFNLFLAGIMIGKGLDGPRAERAASHRGGGGGFHVRSLERYLGEDERAKVRESLHQQRPYIRSQFQALRENEQAIRDLMRAETVDKAALETLFDQHEMLVEATRSPMRVLLTDVLADFSPETRAALADDLFRRHRRERNGERPRPSAPPTREAEEH